MRTCDGCGECCYGLEINEIGKAQHARCEHFCDGCSIYGMETRPDSCADWNCLWLKGETPTSQRPDRSKMLLWLPDKETAASWANRLVMGMETAAASSKRQSNAKIIRRLFRSGQNVMMLRKDGGRDLYLHRPYMMKVVIEAAKHDVVVNPNGNVLHFDKKDAEVIWQKSG